VRFANSTGEEWGADVVISGIAFSFIKILLPVVLGLGAAKVIVSVALNSNGTTLAGTIVAFVVGAVLSWIAYKTGFLDVTATDMAWIVDLWESLPGVLSFFLSLGVSWLSSKAPWLAPVLTWISVLSFLFVFIPWETYLTLNVNPLCPICRTYMHERK
jgi:hypothetical protein